MASKYTVEYLEPIIKQSNSLREAARLLGLNGNAANLNLKPHIIRLGIDTSHFIPNGVNGRRGTPYTDEEVFVINSPLKPGNNGSTGLKTRAKKYIPYQCKCGNTGEWMGNPLTLQIHHKNGENTDNRLENLEFLCSNCHTQTD